MESNPKNLKIISNNDFECGFCSQKFQKETTLSVHICEGKRRAQQKDEPRVRTGFQVFQRFHETLARSKNRKTYDDFCASQYYSSFVKFGSYVNNLKPIYPDRFIDWVIKGQIKLNQWCDDALYETYLQDTIKTEPVEAALERTLIKMTDWAENNSSVFNHYFLYATKNRILHDIRGGHLSPWLILNCESGRSALEKFTDEELGMISQYLDLTFWMNRIRDRPADAQLSREFCKVAEIP